ESAQQAESQYGRAWIYSLCEQAARAQGSGSEEAAQTMCESVVTILQSTDDDDSIQGQLLEVVGYDNMEFLGTLVRQRAHIVTAVREEADFARVSESMALARQRPGALAVVRHARDAGIERQIRKGKHRSTGAGAGAEAADDVQQVLGSGTELRRAREAQLSQRPAQELRPARREAERLPHVYTSSGKATGGGNMLSMFGTRYALPMGTQREEFGDHEEITVPVAGEAPRRATEASVMVSSMDAVCRYTFRKYTALNRIQSIIYPTAYLSNENILLSAPTGAGKTDVALLTILRTISQYCAPAVDLVAWVGDGDKQRPAVRVDRAAFKIVYVAPMKALAAEVVDKYQSRLAWLGIRCRELTGDMQLTKAEVQATQVIVTTPEKWDVVTRKAGGDTELVDKVRLVIMDEIHLLNEERGGVLETLVARTQRHVEARQTPVRLVGLSATLPNYVDVAEFLGVNLQRGLFYFDGGFRPVPLEQHFVGVHAKPGTPAAARLLNRACYVRVQRLVAAGHQVMVFVHARKDTAATAQALREMAAAEGTTEDFTAAVVPAERAVAARLARAGSRELRELAAGGFGVHHAGMGRADRRLAEELFACGAVRVLCCTATLAWGVNLPAYAVVIKGTQVYDAQRGGFGDLSVLDVLQIFGRAGRPQYEPLG
ncbi:activating signal cointegrator 1 complex subunit 3, partial [Coemansia sp. RSA 2703]